MADAPTYPPLPPRRELGMGLMYEPVEGFNVDDMRAFVDADRAARASRPQPSQPLTDAQVGDLCGEANRGYCIESEHYFKAFRDAEEAHGITGRATPSPPVAAVPATPDRYEAIKEMAYLLKMAPRGEVVAVEALRVLGTHYDAALKAAGIAAAQPQPQPAQPLTGAPVRRMTLMRTGQSIPFTALNEEWAQNNHGQSLAKLQDRGGLAPGEALAIIERRKFRVMDAEEALHAVLRHVASITAPSTPTPPPGEKS